MKSKFKNTGSPIRPGDLLLTEQPFVYILSSKENGNRCDSCLVKGKVLKCSGCQFVYYCGRVCQKDAWNEHKWECNNLKRIAPRVMPDAARMLAKIISRLNRGDGQTYRAFYSANSFRMWKDLMSHYSDLKSDSKRMDHFTTLCMVLYDFFKDMSLPNTVELMGIYGRMVINSFTIVDVDMNSIGTGIYLAASILDHSCDPNAVATFDGNTIYIRATKEMNVLDWNQVRISYIDIMKTPYERQNELLESYYFLCQCDSYRVIGSPTQSLPLLVDGICEAIPNEWPVLLENRWKCLKVWFVELYGSQLKYLHGAKCPNDQCNSAVPVKWKNDYQLVIKAEKSEPVKENYSENKEVAHCTECGTKLCEEHIELFKKTMEFTELHLQNMKGASVTYVDVCKYCLERHEGVLHPLNVMHAQTLDLAFDALVQMALWSQACEYARQLLPCLRYYYGDCHPLLGLLHLKYGKILLYNYGVKEALEQLKCSEKILKITHGERHPLYKEELVPLLQEAMLGS